jgi:aryl-alcohol dehydrogenase-like predicted oxidoreductase/Pyruvate/2-oxoacid:ferredoxin oxidoreductase delta subunit
MRKVPLGKTGLSVSKTAIGTVPLQRLDFSESVRLLRSCYDNGVNFYDTSDNYGETAEKVGAAFEGVHDVVVATKISTTDYGKAVLSIETSLRALKTDCISLIQLHNHENYTNGALQAAAKAQRKGYVKHIGYTTHDLHRAVAAAKSGLFAAIQYPLNFLIHQNEMPLISECQRLGVGLIAMKPFAGGMIKDPALSVAFFNRFEHIIPIYGIQTHGELAKLIELENNPPQNDEEFLLYAENERERLSPAFCRGCERCAGVCPADIRVGYAGRLGDFFYRNPPSKYLSDDTWYNEMQKVLSCIDCSACVRSCPFGSDMRPSMKRSYEVFMGFWNTIVV